MKTILVIAGTDPLEGAGVIADGRVMAAHGVQSLVLETAWVDQDSEGVYGFEPASPGSVERRLRRVLASGRVDGVKIGMLASPAIAEVVARELNAWRAVSEAPVVVDPVLAAGGADGRPLAKGDMAIALRALFTTATLWTPNALELAYLAQASPPASGDMDVSDAVEIARSLQAMGAGGVLLKGGHLVPRGVDWLLAADGALREVHRGTPWVYDVHGTGCHLASSIASRLALERSLWEACAGASRWLHGLVSSEAILWRGPGRPQFDPLRLREGISSSSYGV